MTASNLVWLRQPWPANEKGTVSPQAKKCPGSAEPSLRLESRFPRQLLLHCSTSCIPAVVLPPAVPLEQIITPTRILHGAGNLPGPYHSVRRKGCRAPTSDWVAEPGMARRGDTEQDVPLEPTHQARRSEGSPNGHPSGALSGTGRGDFRCSALPFNWRLSLWFLFLRVDFYQPGAARNIVPCACIWLEQRPEKPQACCCGRQQRYAEANSACAPARRS